MALDPLVQRYAKFMPPGDDLTLIVLKGHLLIEEMLSRIVRTIVAHGTLLDDSRFSFAQLAALARSMCWSQHKSDMWDVIASVNTLRNDLAHNLESPQFEGKLRRVLDTQIVSIEHRAIRDKLQSRSPADQLKHAIIYCLGFLDSYRKDAEAYRTTVDSIYADLSKLPKLKGKAKAEA